MLNRRSLIKFGVKALGLLGLTAVAPTVAMAALKEGPDTIPKEVDGIGAYVWEGSRYVVRDHKVYRYDFSGDWFVFDNKICPVYPLR